MTTFNDIDTSDYIRVNELKNYIYCPRIPFYTLCLHLDRETGLSRMGIEAEESVKQRMKRRKQALHAVVKGTRQFDVTVAHHSHRIIGKIDELVETEDGLYLVDYKDTDRDYGYWKVQMWAYQVCAIQSKDKPVIACYVYSIPTQKYHEVKTSKRDQRKFLGILGQLHAMTNHEICPPANTKRSKCGTCQYARICNDIY